MTTVQTMLLSRHTSALALGGCLLAALALAACTKTSPRGRLDPPEVLTSPYDSVKGDALWAVVPLANESGVSTVDTLACSDTLVGVITETRGLTCVPMNRTLAALRALGNRPINSPQAARTLANIMGVDGVVLGSITAYDPYDPPKLGLTLGLFSRDRKAADPFDPMRLQSAYTDADYTIGSSRFADKPVAALSEHLDGANHAVQMDIKRFAAGRHDPRSSLGWRTYLASMTLYTEFAAHLAVSRLIEQERLRVGIPPVTAANAEK